MPEREIGDILEQEFGVYIVIVKVPYLEPRAAPLSEQHAVALLFPVGLHHPADVDGGTYTFGAHHFKC